MKGSLYLVGELLVRLAAVGAHADHLGTGVLEVLVLIAEGARFLGAARRVVLRIEIEDDRLLAAVVAELDGLAGRIRKREVRRLLPGRDGGVPAARDRIEKSHGALTATGHAAESRGAGAWYQLD